MRFYAVLPAVLLAIALLATTARAQDGPTTSTANLLSTAAGLSPIEGAATLQRTDFAIEFETATTELDPRVVYTIWLPIFNAPENCTSPIVDGDGTVLSRCSPGDFENAEAEPAFLRGGWTIADRRGFGRVKGELRAGPPVNNLPAFGQLTNPKGAVVIVAFAPHGPPIAGEVDVQISGPTPGQYIAPFDPAP